MIDMNELLNLKEIIDSTINVEINRWETNPDYGWIDMKFDAITGKDYFSDCSFRGRNHIYSWIQGRGLEALVSHIEWYKSFHGYLNPDLDFMKKMAKTVALNLRKAYEQNLGHLYFCMDEKGYSSAAKDNRFTMSDLFCSRGLYIYGLKYGNEEEKAFGEKYLNDTISSILNDSFYNDQESFSDSQYIKYQDGRTSYAGQMLALGGVVLQMKYGHTKEAPEIGKKLINYVFDNHVNLTKTGNLKWKGLSKGLVHEWISSGKPARNSDGTIVLDPGHALEFTGLASQFIYEYKNGYECAKTDAWVNDTVAKMPILQKANFKKGFNGIGIMKGVNGETGEAISPTTPWWALPETMRAVVLVDALVENNDPWMMNTYKKCSLVFDKYYYKASKTGVAVQTVGPNSKPIAVIPATPDLDPGYHTGLSMINVYQVLSSKVNLALTKARIDITPRGRHLLIGHAARRFKKSESVLDRLYVNTLLLSSAYSQSLIVEYDLLEVDDELTSKMRAAFSKASNVAESSIIIACTHTHTAPSVLYIGTTPVDKKYQKFILEKTVNGLEKAVKSKKVPIKVQTAEASTNFGINRRFKDPESGTFSMKPNPTGPIDKSLPIVAFRNLKGGLEALLFNCSVHPTTLGVSIFAISADYPGRIKKHLKKILGNSVVTVATTGACGDVRPAILSEDKLHFGDGTEQSIETIGEETAKAIVKALESAKDSTGPSQSIVFGGYIPFEMIGIPSKEEIKKRLSEVKVKLAEAEEKAKKMTEFERLHDDPVWAIGADKEWLEKMLKKKTYRSQLDGQIMLWIINGDIMLYCVPGELFAEVGLKLKALSPDSLNIVIGYANGSLGYLPSAKAVNEGGYEIMEAYKHVGHEGRFSEQLESKILLVMTEYLNEFKNGSYK